MLYMSSNSGSDGSYSLTVTFEQGTDIDQAAIDVQNRLNQAEPTLPAAVKQQGITVNKESTNIVLFCALEGDSTGMTLSTSPTTPTSTLSTSSRASRAWVAFRLSAEATTACVCGSIPN